MHFLFIAQTAFSLWMLVDAVRRGAHSMWWIIIMVPFGEWAYFFAVKLPTLRTSSSPMVRRLVQKRMSVDQLRHQLEETPSHENRVYLAQGLHDRRMFAEAGKLFAQVVAADDADKDALYGQARCCIETKENAKAIALLERLTKLDLDYAEFEPCFELADLYTASNRVADAEQLLRRACKKSQRIGPRARLAKTLIATGNTSEARSVLEAGMRTFNSSPKFVRRRDHREASLARRLLRAPELRS